MDDDRFTELMGFFGTHLSRATYALETIANAQTVMAEIEIERYNFYSFGKRHGITATLRPVQCQQPCCREEA